MQHQHTSSGLSCKYCCEKSRCGDHIQTRSVNVTDTRSSCQTPGCSSFNSLASNTKASKAVNGDEISIIY